MRKDCIRICRLSGSMLRHGMCRMIGSRVRPRPRICEEHAGWHRCACLRVDRRLCLTRYQISCRADFRLKARSCTLPDPLLQRSRRSGGDQVQSDDGWPKTVRPAAPRQPLPARPESAPVRRIRSGTAGAYSHFWTIGFAGRWLRSCERQCAGGSLATKLLRFGCIPGRSKHRTYLISCPQGVKKRFGPLQVGAWVASERDPTRLHNPTACGLRRILKASRTARSVSVDMCIGYIFDRISFLRWMAF